MFFLGWGWWVVKGYWRRMGEGGKAVFAWGKEKHPTRLRGRMFGL